MPGRLRVLWAIKGLAAGGSEGLLVSLAKVADHDRFAYEAAYMLEDHDALEPELRAAGVRVHCLGARATLDPRWVLRLRSLIRAGRFDVVHIHSPLVAGVGRLITKSLPSHSRPALVTTEHNVWQNYAILTRMLNRITFGLDDVHLAVSPGVRDSLPERLQNETQVLVQGIPYAEIRAQKPHREQIRRELGLSPDDVVVISVANFRPEKDHPTLVSAARVLIERGLPVRFLLVGHGPLESEVRALARRAGLGDRFRILGYRDDVPRLFAAADIYVMTSRQEGFPLTLMEAMAVSLPVVATTVGGAPMAITDGREGFLVPVGRPEVVADRLERVVTDPSLRERMAAASEQAGERYDIEPVARRTEAVYRTLAVDGL